MPIAGAGWQLPPAHGPYSSGFSWQRAQAWSDWPPRMYWKRLFLAVWARRFAFGFSPAISSRLRTVCIGPEDRPQSKGIRAAGGGFLILVAKYPSLSEELSSRAL